MKNSKSTFSDLKKWGSLLVLFFNLEASAQEELSIRQFIELYQKNDPQYQNLSAEERRLKYLINQGLPSRKTNVSFSHEKGIHNQNTNIFNTEISKNIIESGTSLSLNHAKTMRPHRKEDTIELRLEQSLLKNMFGRDTRLRKDFLSEKVKLRKWEIEEEHEEYISSILNKYLLLNKSYKDFQLAQTIYQEALRLQRNIRSKRRSRIASQTDVKRSNLLTLLKKEDMLRKKNTYDKSRQEIERTLQLDSLKINLKENDRIVSLLSQRSKSQNEIEIEKLRPLLISSLKENMAQKELKLKGRILLPEINFIAGYSIDDSIRFATKTKQKDTILGVKLQIPLGASQSRANYNLAKIDLTQTKMNLQKNKLDIQQQVNSLQISLKEQKEKLDIGNQKVRLARSILADERRRFAIGKIDLERLIDLQNNYSTYRIEYEQSQLQFAQILIDWLALTDKLIEIKKEL